ncbi:MAG: SH3 domain-containing protein [Candidatus Ventricola sp.]
MRDYLLTEISEADAQERMAALPAGEDAEEAEDEAQDEPDQSHTPEMSGPEEPEEIPEEQTEAEDGNSSEAAAVSDTDGEDDAQDGLIHTFPAYAMTLPQDNAMIVLRTQPGGELPQNGAVPMIREPTPLEVTEVQTAADGQSWYLVRNMNTDETGYIEAYKVEEVTREAAEAAVKDEVSVIPPVPSDNETGDTGSGETEDEGGQAGTEDSEPEITEPEIDEPDTPQELEDGDIYHYGYNTGRQVGLRKAPSKSADRIYNMEAGTVLWVMSRDGDWCHVRTDRAEGYVMAEYVQLMGVNEEAAYRASIDDPEAVPEATPVPEETGETTTPAPEETEEAENTPTPSPKPTEEPKSDPTATPAPQQLEQYAVVTRDNTQLRASADGSAYLQAMLAKDDVVYAMHSEMNAAGEMWTLVQADGQWGYVLTDSLRVMDEQEAEDYLAEQEAANATPTPTAEPTATPEPTTTPAPQRLEMYARVLNDGTPLRGNPDPNAYLQTILSKETVVYLFQSQFASDGMMWYLVQYAGQWGYIRADLVRPMGEQETAEYLAALEAELATPTPMPQATPEPIGPDSTSAYAKLIKDKVNLRRTPSASGTSLDRVPVNTLLLVLGSEYDGTYTWYQVTYNDKEGYIRSDMAQMLTIAELTAYYQEQMEQAQSTAKPGVSTTPNSSNNTSIVIGGSQLQDLIPVDDSWTNNVIDGMPSYATATPDPNATPTPVPPAKAAALIRSSGDITVSNVPAMTESGTFSVYGQTKAYSTVTATVEMTVEAEATAAPATIGQSLISSAIAEAVQTVKRTVGQAVADENGHFEMDVTLPQPGEYIVEFTAADGAYAQYGVTYDTGATPEPTAQPLPTAMPVEEDGGMGILPFVIGGLLIVVAAAVYGVYVYRRRSEQEEDEEDEDDEAELREEQLNMQRQRRTEASAPRTTSTVIPGTQRTQTPPAAANAQVPSYMKNTQTRTPVSPYARPAAPNAPVKPQAPAAPNAPVKPQAPVAPTAPVKPQAPVAPTAPVKPQAPVAPTAPVKPQAPTVTTAANEQPQADAPAEAPRRRRRPPVDPNA